MIKNDCKDRKNRRFYKGFKHKKAADSTAFFFRKHLYF